MRLKWFRRGQRKDPGDQQILRKSFDLNYPSEEQASSPSPPLPPPPLKLEFWGPKIRYSGPKIVSRGSRKSGGLKWVRGGQRKDPGDQKYEGDPLILKRKCFDFKKENASTLIGNPSILKSKMRRF